MYLITEHRDIERKGQIIFKERKNTWPDKNKEGHIQTFSDGNYETVGKQVCLGYHDFTEEEWGDNDHVVEVIDEKLLEVDDKWLMKAGVGV